MPGAKVSVNMGNDSYTGTANGDGFFDISVARHKAGTQVSVTVNGEASYDGEICETPEKDFLAEDGIIRRYLGMNSVVTIPNDINGAGKITAIGESAFENNRISSLYVYGFMEGYTDGLTEIPSAAFRNNRLTEAVLPAEINKVASDAFDNNSNGDQRFIIQSDNEDILPTKGYDVRRSDGTLLRYEVR